ncbi:fibulin-1-like [Lingula anatina]|uniref:Fibulin-1-like n=1 Tax=Lingula anatina TaxID=7574 RepID=A0A2R2MLV3_LINAN|nr:fibulin-1-like [Lingula anatina]|eukprot:XP_023931185.1 fibulin-1-like [Lingula anatina]
MGHFSHVDVNECEESEVCGPNSVCTNTVGSYECACAEGYTMGDDGQCVDVDECLPGTNCDVNAQCTNTEGSFECACAEGYEGDGLECTDIDECSNDDHDCHSDAVCINTAGSFECACSEGFEGDGRTCTAVAEEEELPTCESRSCKGDCLNYTDGGQVCRCRSWKKYGNGCDVLKQTCSTNWKRSCGKLQLDDGVICKFWCPPGCNEAGKLFGNDTYTANSHVCRAVIHAGLDENAEGGFFLAVGLTYDGPYEGVTRFGLTSRNKNRYTGGTFRIVGDEDIIE